MQKLALVAAAFLLAIGFVQPAEARVFVGVGVGCCGGYYPGYGYPYAPYYAPYYVAPPPVVYTVPPPSPVVYATPPAVASAPAPVAAAASAPPVASVDPNSPTYTDSQGRTCRQYQASSGGTSGMACLQPDGTWRAVQ